MYQRFGKQSRLVEALTTIKHQKQVMKKVIETKSKRRIRSVILLSKLAWQPLVNRYEVVDK